MRHQALFTFTPTLVIAFTLACPALAQHAVLIQGDGKLAVVQPSGEISWQMPWGGIHDIQQLENGHILTRRGADEVVEIDPKTNQVVWQYNSGTANGNEGQRVEVHAAQRMANGNTMIAESGPARIIVIDEDGKIQRNIPLVVDHPNPHTDTRLVRITDKGNFLVAHEADGMVREYDGKTGDVIWQYEVPMFDQQEKGGHGPEAFGNRLFAALRLANGNTLITTGNGHGVIEVTADKQVVWQLAQNDLPGITLAWVTTIEVMPNGNYIVGNCHAGPGQPQLIEINPATKKVVWQFDRFDEFGNDVSNTQIVGPEMATLR